MFDGKNFNHSVEIKMRKNKIKVCILVSVLILSSCCKTGYNKVKYPYVQEYVVGKGNIKGSVDIEKYVTISKDFEIGANKDGYAVFKIPEKAFDKLFELYADGIKLIQKEFDLEPLSADNYDWYGIYGVQVENGTDEEKLQAKFISQFIDIYENSFKRE